MPSFRPPQCTESPKNIKSQPRSISSCPRRKCTESPKNIKSQHRWSKATLVGSVLNLQRTSNHNKPSQLLCCFVSVLNLQRTSNHNCSGCATIHGLVYWISKEHQITTVDAYKVGKWKCTESPKNIKSQLPCWYGTPLAECTESPKNIKSQPHRLVPFSAHTVYWISKEHQITTKPHPLAERLVVYWISKEHQITTSYVIFRSKT